MLKGGRFIAVVAASAILLSVVSLTQLSSNEEPGRPKTTGYPDVEDLPPRPEKPAMKTPDELAKLKKDLSATRDRQAPDAKAKAHPAPPARPAMP
jgi:hypothetical protein